MNITPHEYTVLYSITSDPSIILKNLLDNIAFNHGKVKEELNLTLTEKMFHPL